MKTHDKNNLTTEQNPVEIDKPIFIASLCVIIFVCLFCIIFPELSLNIVEVSRIFVITRFDWLFMTLGIVVLTISIYLGVSRFGNIVLSRSKEGKEFSFWSWIAMIYFSAIGSSTLIWAVCEPLAYLVNPPFNYTPFSKEAADISIVYGLFHWGPIAWAYFALSGLVVAYFFYIKNQKHLQLSHVLADVIGSKNVNGFLGKTIDVLSIFFTFCTFGPSLGFGVPILSALIANLTGIPDSHLLQFFVLLIWTSIFTISVYRGLTKGIKILSDINLWLLFLFLILVFFVSDPLYILRKTIVETGQLVTQFIPMACNLDIGPAPTFAQDWTVFYWVWWIVEIPFMSIFIARISKGRTVRELLFGIIGAGSIGTMSIFWILGNYALKLQTTNTLDLSSIYSAKGQTAAMIATIQSLPFSNVISVVLILLFFVFLATCIDSGSFTMGCISSKQILDGQQPSKLNRSVWALTIALLGVAVLRLGGGLEAIKTIVIVVGLPAAVLLIMMIWVLFQWLHSDYPQR